MAQSDVLSTLAVATGTIFADRQRVKGIWVVATGTAGNLTLRDGGAAGTVKIDLDTPAIVSGFWIDLPENGVLFETDIHLTIDANVTSVTVFYG